MRKQNPIAEILAIIVDSKDSKKIIEDLKEQGVNLQIATSGKGTANSNFGELFNFDDTAKELLLSMIKLEDKDNIMGYLTNLFESGEIKGVAFTIP